MSGNHHSALSKRDLLWGLAAQALNIGLMIIMLPVILRFMPRSEIGIWFVFVAITGMVQLLELGFQNVLSRSFSYVYAGAQELLPTGLSAGVGPLNKALLAIVLGSARRVYLIIAMLAAVSLWGAGTLYVYSVLPTGMTPGPVLWSWAAYSTGLIINFYYGYLNALLQGRGDMRKSNQTVVITKVAQLVFSIVLVAIFKLGLVGLGLASVMATVVNRFVAFRFAYAPDRTEMRVPPPDRAAISAMVKVLWHNASRYGVALIGSFLIARANVLIAASRIGVVETAGYSLALQLLVVTQAVATMPFYLSVPRLSHLRAVGDTAASYRLFSSVLAGGAAIFAVAGLVLVVFGNQALTLLGSSTSLPDQILLGAMTLIFLLELVHGICANLLAAGNEVPFGRAGLITGACIAVLAWIGAPHFGVAWLVVVVGVCQLAYNNWKWPLMAARQFNTTLPALLKDGWKFTYKSLLQRARSS